MPNSMDYIFDKILYELNQYIETNTNKVTESSVANVVEDNKNAAPRVIAAGTQVPDGMVASLHVWVESLISKFVNHSLTADKVSIAEGLHKTITDIKTQNLSDSSPEQCRYRLDQLNNVLSIGKQNVHTTLTQHDAEQGRLDIIIETGINALMNIKEGEIVIDGDIKTHSGTILALSHVLKLEGGHGKGGKIVACIELTRSTAIFLMQAIIDIHIGYAKEKAAPGYKFDLPEATARKLLPEIHTAISKLFDDNKETDEDSKKLSDLAIVFGSLMQNANESKTDMSTHTPILHRAIGVVTHYNPFASPEKTFMDRYILGLEDIKVKIDGLKISTQRRQQETQRQALFTPGFVRAASSSSVVDGGKGQLSRAEKEKKVAKHIQQ